MIEERLIARVHNGAVQAFDRIDTSTDPPQRIGFRVVLPAGYRIEGTVAGTAWAFTSAQVAALGGIVPLETPQPGVWTESEDPGEPGQWVYPGVSWRVSHA